MQTQIPDYRGFCTKVKHKQLWLQLSQSFITLAAALEKRTTVLWGWSSEGSGTPSPCATGQSPSTCGWDDFSSNNPKDNFLSDSVFPSYVSKYFTVLLPIFIYCLHALCIFIITFDILTLFFFFTIILLMLFTVTYWQANFKAIWEHSPPLPWKKRHWSQQHWSLCLLAELLTFWNPDSWQMNRAKKYISLFSTVMHHALIFCGKKV